MTRRWPALSRLGAQFNSWATWAAVATAWGILITVAFVWFQDSVLCSLQLHIRSNGACTGAQADSRCTDAARDLNHCLRDGHLLRTNSFAGVAVLLLIILMLALSVFGLILLFWSMPSADGDMLAFHDSSDTESLSITSSTVSTSRDLENLPIPVSFHSQESFSFEGGWLDTSFGQSIGRDSYIRSDRTPYGHSLQGSFHDRTPYGPSLQGSFQEQDLPHPPCMPDI